MSEAQDLSAPVASAPARQICQGPVMPIGGAEDKSPGSDILERFVALAGGERARIAIIPTASEEAQEAGERYVKVFRKLGVAEADWLRVETREDAQTEPALPLLRNATGIFITGGDQARLVALLAGTPGVACIPPPT